MSEELHVDDYIRNVIELGGEGSRFLAVKAAPTLRNNEFVRILTPGMNGLATVKIPQDHYAVVHSIGGDPKILDLGDYAASMVDRLVQQSRAIGGTPIALANVIDSSTGDIALLGKIIDSIVQQAGHYHIAILNGENAILGNRISKGANVTGTMISMIDSRIGEQHTLHGEPTRYHHRRQQYVVFDPKNMPLYMNSDGIGTKTEFYERLLELQKSKYNMINFLKELFDLMKFGRLINDSAAMKLDDTIKIGAKAVALSDVVETRGRIPLLPLHRAARKFYKYGIEYILQHEDVGDRLRGYSDESAAINVSGSAVSMIDERYLINPLKPSAGEVLIAIKGKPNPRSNGITSIRKIMVDWMGNEWHRDPEGIQMLEYLAEPSTVLYPLFKELLDNKLATSFYHMSGGAYNGKLARPLAKHGLHITFDKKFDLDDRLVELMEHADIKWKDAFGKWPMGIDGFVTARNSRGAIAIIRQKGYDAEIIGSLQKSVDGRTGVDIPYYGVYFSGKD